MKSMKTITIGIVALMGLIIPILLQADERSIIGATEVIRVVETEMDFLARIDTGAKTTSIHAEDITIDEGSVTKSDNLGKMITFTTVNFRGETKRLTLPIESVIQVKNAQGIEHRYVVEFTLELEGHQKSVLVNLRDRSAMEYKLLIGRNWLSGDYLVDVEQDAR